MKVLLRDGRVVELDADDFHMESLLSSATKRRPNPDYQPSRFTGPSLYDPYLTEFVGEFDTRDVVGWVKDGEVALNPRPFTVVELLRFIWNAAKRRR